MVHVLFLSGSEGEMLLYNAVNRIFTRDGKGGQTRETMLTLDSLQSFE